MTPALSPTCFSPLINITQYTILFNYYIYIYATYNLPYEKVGKNGPVCIAEEVPFKIPASWEWVRLGNVLDIARGGSPRPIKSFLTDSPNGINWIKIGDADKGGKYIYSTKEKITPEGVSKSRMVYEGDFLLTNSMSFGRPYILKTRGCIHDGWLVLSDQHQCYSKDFLYILLSSSFAYNQFCDVVSGAVVKNLNSDKVSNALFPLPPLEEQNRIANKIEEFIPLIEKYGEAQATVDSLNKSFPGKLKKSILQEAVQGKLVSQDENDEPASMLLERIRAEKEQLIKEGKIKKDKNESLIFRRDNSHYEKHGSEEVCIDEELPFEIPDSWVWCRLSNLAYNIFAGGDKPKDFTTNITKENKYPVIANGITNDGILGYTACPTAKANTITVAGRGTIGFSLYRTYEYCPIVRLIVIEQCQDINPQYLQYVIEAFPEKSLGTSIPQLTVPMLKPKLIPIPPLSEQNRIVKQIDKLLSTVKLI